GQMLARALGARVARSPAKEIGWVPVEVERTPTAAQWFGEARGFAAFQWHEDAFAVPAGAQRILTGAHCPNQAYVADGRHLGMQCHVEVTAEMIETWCRIGIGEIDEAIGKSPAVQDAASIRAQMLEKLAPLTATASRLYERWIEGLKR
ncbi:MAG TPA: type 1 glutamine amidotransferase, partial [Usitatibacter sp.]